MDAGSVQNAIEWGSLFYVAGISLAYLVLNLVSFVALGRHRQRQTLAPLWNRYSSKELPVSIIMSAVERLVTRGRK